MIYRIFISPYFNNLFNSCACPSTKGTSPDMILSESNGAFSRDNKDTLSLHFSGNRTESDAIDIGNRPCITWTYHIEC